MNGVQHKVVGTGAGIASAMILSANTSDPLSVIVAGAAIVGCMLPDIDHDKTKIGRKRKVVTTAGNTLFNVVVYGGIALALVAIWAVAYGFASVGVNITNLVIAVIGLIVVAVAKKIIGSSQTFRWAAKHRGLMHTLLVPVIGVILYFASSFGLWRYAMMGLVIGYLSHLFADMQTVEGCPVLFPFTRNNIRFMKLSTKDSKCTVFAYIDAALFIGLAYYYVTYL